MDSNHSSMSEWTLNMYQNSEPHHDDFFIGIERLCEIMDLTYEQIMEVNLEYRIWCFGARLIDGEVLYNLRIIERYYFLVTGETFQDYRY